MAMLAEKKHKVKMSLNPRGNDWANDKNKFGQKLLEKMGWSPGTGLGAQGQGRTDFIRVSKKNDTKGFGNKEKYAEAWTKQQENFDNLLSQLNGSDNVDSTKVVIPSLEDKSKKSKARVHYHKFTRGKDVSKYSSKDLSSIIGVTGKQPEDSCEDFTVNGKSMYDYFKMKSKKVNRVTYEGKSYVEISDSFPVSGGEDVNESENIYENSKKKNSNRKTFEIEETTVENNRLEQSEISLQDAGCLEISDSFAMSEGGNELENLYGDSEKKKRKKKAKQITFEIEEIFEETTVENNHLEQSEISLQDAGCLEISDSFAMTESGNELENLYGDSEKKKRKKKAKQITFEIEESIEQDPSENACLDQSEIPVQEDICLKNSGVFPLSEEDKVYANKENKKRKKNSKRKTCDIEESFELTTLENDSIEIPAKRKKNKKEHKENIIEEVIEEQESNAVENIGNNFNSQPRKKNKKRNKERLDS